MNEELYNETNNIRNKLFNSLGIVDSDVIAHLINPSFKGGPRWPAQRQAFSIIRTDESIKVVSNGLSDPFDDIDEPNNGFRLEIIAETKEDIGSDISSSWLFRLVYLVSQQVAHNGQIAQYLEKYGVITMELFAEDNGLELFQNEKGMAGVMIGIEHPDLPRNYKFPAENIILATVQILTPDELEYVSEKRAEGRKHLNELMKQSGLFHYISTKRNSLLKSFENTNKPWWKFWR